MSDMLLNRMFEKISFSLNQFLTSIYQLTKCMISFIFRKINN